MVDVFQRALLKLFMRGIDSRKLESASMLACILGRLKVGCMFQVGIQMSQAVVPVLESIPYNAKHMRYCI